MHDTLPLLINSDFPAIRRNKLEILQANLGYKCNQSCQHCHVNAGPNRTEEMSLDTIENILSMLKNKAIKKLDLTGGAPELNPHFKYLVSQARALNVHIIDRCNLTVLNEPGQEDLAEFLALNEVEIVASLPCYQEVNVDKQRGQGVFQSSIIALKKLNALGYGMADSNLQLNLMYNPSGASLPPNQQQLEQDYKKQLLQRDGIRFNTLFSLTNMPIKRFGSTLISKNKFAEYMHLLKSAFQPQNLNNVMCTSLLSIDWQGYIYDCDFNQMLDLPLFIHGQTKPHINDLLDTDFTGNPVIIADHCYGCTAGQGSSCGGALN